MSKLLKILLGVGLFGYLVILIVVATPATLVTANLAKVIPQLQLAIVSGTAWRGKASDAVVVIEGKPFKLNTLRWKFKPLSLLAFKACVDLKSQAISGNVCRTITGKNQLHRLQLDAPMALGNQFISGFELAGAGSLSIVSAEVSDKGEVSKLDGSMNWRGARVKVQGTWFTLGDFAAELTEAAEGAIRASIIDLAGPFGVKLNATAGIRLPPSAEGEVTPRDDAPDLIKDALGLVAIPQENGAFKVTYPL